MKTCNVCEESLREVCFDRRGAGYRATCKDCRRAARYTLLQGEGLLKDKLSGKDKTLGKCPICGETKLLSKTGFCRACNEASLCRECKVCCRVLPLWREEGGLNFYGDKTKCKLCLKRAKASSPAAKVVLVGS